MRVLWFLTVNNWWPWVNTLFKKSERSVNRQNQSGCWNFLKAIINLYNCFQRLFIQFKDSTSMILYFNSVSIFTENQGCVFFHKERKMNERRSNISWNGKRRLKKRISFWNETGAETKTEKILKIEFCLKSLKIYL